MVGSHKSETKDNTILHKFIPQKLIYFCTFSFGHCVVCSSSIYGFCIFKLFLAPPLSMKVSVSRQKKVTWVTFVDVSIFFCFYNFLLYFRTVLLVCYCFGFLFAQYCFTIFMLVSDITYGNWTF